jgi:hypothetical protein
MIIYNLLVVLCTTYTAVAIFTMLYFTYMKAKWGADGINRVARRIAGTWLPSSFVIFANVAVVAWVLLALPWVNLFTIHYGVDMKVDGFQTYFGTMTGSQSNLYIVLVLVNIIAAKSLPLIELMKDFRNKTVQVV